MQSVFSVDQALQQAVQLHQSGSLQEAKNLYQQILAVQPNHFDALHLSGVVAIQNCQYAAALELIDHAIVLNPKNAQAYSNRGNALDGLQRSDDALASYRQAITIDPNFAQAHFNYARALHLTQHLDEAVQAYDLAVQLKPDYAQAWDNRGSALKAQGRLEQAIESYERALEIDGRYYQAYANCASVFNDLKRWNQAVQRFDQAIAINPKFAQAYSGRGTAFYELGEVQEALSNYEEAIGLRPDHASDYYNKGVVLKSLGQFEEALAAYDQAIMLDKSYAEAYCNRGSLLKDMGRLEDAIENYRLAIQSKPHFSEPHYNLGIALHELGRGEAAMSSYDRALVINPNYAQAHDNRASLLRERNDLEAAIEGYDCAIAADPTYTQAYSNRGVALKDMQRMQEALESYDQAIRIDPDYGLAYFNKSLTLLLAGEFESAWSMYEWRWKRGKDIPQRPIFSAPLWLGEANLEGKSILLHCEQGLGDTIQFCRYVPMVGQLGAQVIFEVPQALMALMETLHHQGQLIPAGEALPHFDYQCPLLSLPMAFRTTRSSIPVAFKYLSANADKLAHWANVLGTQRLRRVGLVWSGNAAHINDFKRSISLDQILKCLPEHLEYFSLQKEVRTQDAQALKKSSIRHFGDQLTDLSDTSALCELMDVVISVDTSVAHLSGALGKKTWVLLPFSPDWRWLLHTEGSPWYPSMTLIRQKATGQWGVPLERVREKLLSL